MNMNQKKIILRGTVILGLALATVPFNNCSQNPQNASVPETAFLAAEQQDQTLKSEFKDRVPASFCSTNEAYSCMRKVFSASVEDSMVKPAQECTALSESLQLCPSVQTVQYNTEVAQLNCDRCEENFEYMEYTCHLKIPNSEGIYPAIITRPTMKESLYDLYKLCISIAYKNQE